jgi:hypothetical protein
MWPALAAGPKGWQNECFNCKKKIDFLGSPNFILLTQMKEYSMHNYDLFEVCNSGQKQPLLLHTPGLKKLATPLVRTLKTH